MDGRYADREVNRKLGRNLWLARRRAGYSQEALGALCGLHRTEIGFVENGERLPRVDTLLKLSGALGVGAERLLDGIEWIPPGPTAGGSFVVRRAA
ncbi:MAG: helix-turn-helix transcriptional regulator [Solirubrobacterales bacterium]